MNFEFECINSSNNLKWKSWKKCKTAKGRSKENRFLVESRKLVVELLYSDFDVEYILINEEKKESVLNDIEKFGKRFFDSDRKSCSDRKINFKSEVGFKIEVGSERKVNFNNRIILLNGDLFSKLSGMENPDGIIAVVNGKIGKKLDNYEKILINKKNSNEKNLRLLILDKLQDSGNIGTILRSAEAFGFDSVIGINCVDYENEKLLRASMGAAFRLNLYSSDANSVIEWINTNKIPMIGSDMTGIDYRKFEYPERFALVIGNEGSGISNELKNASKYTLTIPMQGRTESLNAAISASILMASSVK